MYLHNFFHCLLHIKVQISFTYFYSKYSLSCTVLLKKPERAKRTIKGLSITREKFAPSSVYASYDFIRGSVAYPAGSFSQVASSLAIQQR